MQKFNQKKRALIDFIPAQLSEGKEWFIYYYALNPETGELERVRLKFNRIKSLTERKRQAKRIMHNINSKLEQGWNPFVNPETNKSYNRIGEVFELFMERQKRNLKEGAIRLETFNGYNSYSNNILDYLKKKGDDKMYVSKFDKAYINHLLDYLYLQKGRTAKTRDNYLAFLRVFSTFLVSYDFAKVKPTDGITVLGKKHGKDKKRNIIPEPVLKKIFTEAEKENPYFLLACYVLYYCFVRPKEMSYVKLEHINMEKNTIYIDGRTAKNYKDAVVTIRKPLKELILKLGIMNMSGENYLFSDQFRPGKNRRDEKQFRDQWLKLRKRLKFPDNYQFYSLKDTGITNLLRATGDPQAVRDQARHHSLAMTDIYTPHDMMRGNERLAEL